MAQSELVGQIHVYFKLTFLFCGYCSSFLAFLAILLRLLFLLSKLHKVHLDVVIVFFLEVNLYLWFFFSHFRFLFARDNY